MTKTAASISLYITGVLVLAFAGDIAYAAHYAAEAPGLTPPAGTWSWTDLGAIAGLIALALSAVSTALHVIAPRTKTKVDDDIVAKLDAALKFIGELQPLLKPANGVDSEAARRFLAGGLRGGQDQTAAMPALQVVDGKVKP